MPERIGITRGELYERVWKTPAVKLASEFGISDVALGKLCRKMDVPKPPRGHWQKIGTGSRIKPVPLPKATTKTTELIYVTARTADDVCPVDPEIQTMVDREGLPENRIKVSGDLADAHALVKKTKMFYDGSDAGNDGLTKLPPGKGCLNVSVSPRKRSVRFLSWTRWSEHSSPAGMR